MCTSLYPAPGVIDTSSSKNRQVHFCLRAGAGARTLGKTLRRRAKLDVELMLCVQLWQQTGCLMLKKQH